MGLLDWWYNTEQLQAEGNAADAKLREMNERDYGQGGRIYELVRESDGVEAAEANHVTVLDNLTSSQTGNVSAQISDAFDEGWEDGKGNVSGAVGGIFGTVKDVLTSVLKGVPWWVWGIVIIYFAWPFIAAKLTRRGA